MLTENFHRYIGFCTGLTQKALRKKAVQIGIPSISIFGVLSHKINKKSAEDEDRSSGAGEGEGGVAPTAQGQLGRILTIVKTFYGG